MFETLSRGFKSAQEKLTGKATLDAENIQEAIRDVRMSLLEADVELNVVKAFLRRVEEKAIGELVDAHPEATLLVTADHGMSPKTTMVDLGGALGRYGIRANPVPIIKDRYVVHHSNLGGCIFVYLEPGDMHKMNEALKVLRETPGVESAFAREQAVEEFRLHRDRIGDIVVTGGPDVVFGDPNEIETLRARLATTHGVRVAYHRADMTKPGEIAELMATAEADIGPLDVVVNNAGIQKVAAIEDFPVEKWDEILAIRQRILVAPAFPGKDPGFCYFPNQFAANQVNSVSVVEARCRFVFNWSRE